MRGLIDARALCPAVDMQGLGYSGGYADGRGLGVWRGVFRQMTEMRDGQIRFVGLASVVVGGVLLMVTR